jgi:hypothetical protein
MVSMCMPHWDFKFMLMEACDERLEQGGPAGLRLRIEQRLRAGTIVATWKGCRGAGSLSKSVEYERTRAREKIFEKRLEQLSNFDPLQTTIG